MIQVIVDIRCTSQSGLGCYQLGLKITQQAFDQTYYPAKLTIVSDTKGFKQLDKLAPIQNEQIVINGHFARVARWTNVSSMNVTSNDFYIRIGMCGLGSNKTPLPGFQIGHTPKIILIAQPNFFSSMRDFARITNQLPYRIAACHLIGLNATRCGLPHLRVGMPQATQPFPISHPFALAFGDYKVDNFTETLIAFLRFSQLMNHTLKHFVCIGKIKAIKAAIDTYNTRFNAHAHIHDNTIEQANNDDSDIHIYALKRVPPSQFHGLLIHSEPLIMSAGVMSVYEALSLKKLVFNQHMTLNIKFWYDLGATFNATFTKTPAQHIPQAAYISLLNYLFNPIANAAQHDDSLLQLKRSDIRLAFIERLHSVVDRRSGTFIPHLQATLKPIKAEKEKAQADSAISTRENYYGRLGIFRTQTKTSNTTTHQTQLSK